MTASALTSPEERDAVEFSDLTHRIKRDMHAGRVQANFVEHGGRHLIGLLSEETWDWWRDVTLTDWSVDATHLIPGLLRPLPLPPAEGWPGEPEPPLTVFGMPLFRDDSVPFGRAHVRCSWQAQEPLPLNRVPYVRDHSWDEVKVRVHTDASGFAVAAPTIVKRAQRHSDLVWHQFAVPIEHHEDVPVGKALFVCTWAQKADV